MLHSQELLVATRQDGVRYPGIGGLICKIPSASTGNAFTVLEFRLAPGEGAPLHMHTNEDEVIVIRDGACVIAQPDREWHMTTGDVVVFPKHTVHAFRNAGHEPCTLLITAVPGGLDRYFAEVSEALLSHKPELLAGINERYGIRFLA